MVADHLDIAAVVHCAAKIVAPESVEDPLGYGAFAETDKVNRALGWRPS